MDVLNKTDEEIQKASKKLGVSLQALARLSIIEYLKNHYNINIINSEGNSA